MTTPDDKPAERKLHVVDRRHWADQGGNDDQPSRQNKPSYVEDLEGQLKEREEKLNDTLNRHRAAVAEFEQVRTRLQRDVSVEVERQKRLIFIELLEVVDNLDRAVDAAEHATAVTSLRQGVDMVRQQFLAKLGALGVGRKECRGQKFDPIWHEAVARVPVDDDNDDGRIVGVVQEGYAINDEPLRPARVAVGVKKGT